MPYQARYMRSNLGLRGRSYTVALRPSSMIRVHECNSNLGMRLENQILETEEGYRDYRSIR